MENTMTGRNVGKTCRPITEVLLTTAHSLIHPMTAVSHWNSSAVQDR